MKRTIFLLLILPQFLFLGCKTTSSHTDSDFYFSDEDDVIPDAESESETDDDSVNSDYSDDITDDTDHDYDAGTADEDRVVTGCNEGDTQKGTTDCGTNGVLLQECKNGIWVDTETCTDEFTSGDAVLRRIGHREVFDPGNTDAPGDTNRYYSVAALGDNLVAASSIWGTPQVFRFFPEAGILKEVAFVWPHQGNEDDKRFKIRAHKSTGGEKFIFWHYYSYEDSDENPSNGYDGVILSEKIPYPITEEKLPKANVQALNLANKTGITSPGLAYDDENRLIFVTLEGKLNTEKDDMLQIFRFNKEKNVFEGRVQVFDPVSPATAKDREMKFVDVSPKHRVILAHGGTMWDNKSDFLFFAEYVPKDNPSAELKNIQILPKTKMYVQGSDKIQHKLQSPSGAVFVTKDNKLYALLGGNVNGRNEHNYDNFSFGIYLFDLGNVGGPYTISSPIAMVPMKNAIFGMKTISSRLIVSSYGLHMFDLNEILEAKGVQNINPSISYPLPYLTHEFDIDEIEGKSYIFLAADHRGIDIFSLSGGSELISGEMSEPESQVQLENMTGSALLETGNGLMHIGAPALNDNGDFAVWGVTDNQREVIVMKKKGEKAKIIADTENRYASFSRPSINNSGNVTFYGGRTDGGEVLLLYKNGVVSEVLEQSSERRRLSEPEISGNDDILFMECPVNGTNSLRILHTGKSVTTVIEAADKSYPFTFHLDTFYDISPEGKVSYVRLINGDLEPSETWLWENGNNKKILSSSPVREHFRTRMSKGSVTGLKVWESEIAKLATLTSAGDLKVIAEHRAESKYKWAWGNFFNIMPDSRGNAVFTAVYDNFNKSDTQTGNWLHYYDKEKNVISRITKCGSEIDGGKIVDIDFTDSFNENGMILFTVTTEKGSTIHQAIIKAVH